MPIPNIDQMISAYPMGESDAVKQQIGGGVNARWITNTCAIRLSRSFNGAGEPIPRGPASDVSGLHTVRGGDRKNYAYRVAEFDKWLRGKYGPPTLSFTSGPYGTAPASLAGKKGIICFVDCGWSDATGHLDLWDGVNVVNHGYFDKAKRVYLWESRPAVGGAYPCTMVARRTTNVREGPSTSAQVLGQIEPGQAVSALGKSGDFYRIGDSMFVWAANFRPV